MRIFRHAASGTPTQIPIGGGTVGLPNIVTLQNLTGGLVNIFTDNTVSGTVGYTIANNAVLTVEWINAPMWVHAATNGNVHVITRY
jgi:hypothetical protein